MDRDRDRDRTRETAFCCGLTLAGCGGICGLLLIIGAYIWLIIITVRFDNDGTRLDRLITDCNGVCPAATTGTVTAGLRGAQAVHALSARNAAAATGKKNHKAGQPKPAKPPKQTHHEQALPVDVAPPRWTRVGNAKKPDFQQ